VFRYFGPVSAYDMDEDWYVEWQGWLVVVVSQIAWIVSSSTRARSHVWNTLHSGIASPENRSVVFGVLMQSGKGDDGSREPATTVSSLSHFGDVVR